MTTTDETIPQTPSTNTGKVEHHRFDVVIVGAGGAGMRAALESGKRARTAVLTKLYPCLLYTSPSPRD